jgi:hypothetical protein
LSGENKKLAVDPDFLKSKVLQFERKHQSDFAFLMRHRRLAIQKVEEHSRREKKHQIAFAFRKKHRYAENDFDETVDQVNKIFISN